MEERESSRDSMLQKSLNFFVGIVWSAGVWSPSHRFAGIGRRVVRTLGTCYYM